MRTIGRNATRQIAALKSELTECKVYTLDNYFIGASVDASCAWDAMDRRGGKLTDHGDGRYTMRVHANCWYELRTAPPVTDLECPECHAPAGRPCEIWCIADQAERP